MGVLGAAVSQEDVQLLGLELVVLLDPNTVLFECLDFCPQSLIQLLQGRDMAIFHGCYIRVTGPELLQLSDPVVIVIFDVREETDLILKFLNDCAVITFMGRLEGVEAFERVDCPREQELLFSLLCLESL